MEKCFQCGKEISDDEYVVNWGSCSKCFDANYQKYLDNKMTDPDTIQKWLDAINDHGTNLTVWEEEFIESISQYFKRHGKLTESQAEIVERIYAQKTP